MSWNWVRPEPSLPIVSECFSSLQCTPRKLRTELEIIQCMPQIHSAEWLEMALLWMQCTACEKVQECSVVSLPLLKCRLAFLEESYSTGSQQQVGTVALETSSPSWHPPINPHCIPQSISPHGSINLANDTREVGVGRKWRGSRASIVTFVSDVVSRPGSSTVWIQGSVVASFYICGCNR